MNSIAKYFLPSQIRGVYRFDDKLTKIYKKNRENNFEDKMIDFIKEKLCFLPEEQYSYFSKFIFNGEKIDYLEIIEDQFFTHNVASKSNKEKYIAYFKTYTYFQNQIEKNKGTKNYLEAEFIRKVLSPILTLEGLLKVEPQLRIGKYYADFIIIGEKKYVIEIDGFEKFKARDNLDDFLRRQNEIQEKGWIVYRYSYTDIIGNTDRTKKKIYNILSKDNKLSFFLISVNKQANIDIFKSIPNSKSYNPIDFVNTYYQIQDHCVHQFSSLDKEKICVIEDFDYPFSVVALSLSSLYSFFDEIEKLFGINFELPEIFINTHKPVEKDFLHEKIKISETHEELFDFEINSEIIDSDQNNRLYAYDTGFKFKANQELEDIRENLWYITKSIFRYPNSTKDIQNEMLQHIFNGFDVLGIAPTGSGKSFCFWLPALLKPGLSIVISPLRSLMRDQRLSLESKGIASIDFINSDVKKSERIRIMNDLYTGKIKLLYVAPERIAIREFVEELNIIQKYIRINYLIIDEAHCISEWGHDFRPSYLNIPYFFKKLKTKNPHLQLIALTATAGQMVKKDIMNILEFTKDNLVSAKNFDRNNFSYQVEIVNSPAEKNLKYQEILTHSIPKALAHSIKNHDSQNIDLKTILASTNSQGEKALGISFVIYANPHGKHTLDDGISHYLYQTKQLIEPENNSLDDLNAFYGKGKVRAFSSKEPTHCPNPDCHSYRYISYQREEHEEFCEDFHEDEVKDFEAGQKICIDKSHIFDGKNAIKPEKYSEITMKNQDDFKKGKFDILVATKGFGMGIDKGSIRFVVHTSLASSTESWYQEAGRAGRDDERTHCCILTDIPSESCLKELKDNPLHVPMCSFKSGCLHGKEYLCDYAKQHIFIKNNYPSVESDVVSIVKVLDKLVSAVLHGSGNSEIRLKSSKVRQKKMN